ncbi:NUDIX domain-containing protein [Streptomyces sp. SCUT-3]|uniref:NUDIX hydrolase n=1 Tax=Streptomyces sp. SCUT-3 TaxID=2684469 RepID=UPI000CC4E54B|nr:NUDIX domain-containing protein [Streptomyces sp. SCUT-3]PLW74300.1 DNA mismatch repair protein MutT [Streptomyces sp. DJ]QMV24075.1 NUDIX domain-containing protein [Streptomyces sp. SCUT-3]
MAGIIDKVAWIRVEEGKVLSTRSRGKDAYYFPGGKREAGESDLQTLVREAAEELTVEVLPETASLMGVYEAQAHGRADGVLVRMTCMTADYRGTLTPSSEIEEVVWLTYADRDRVSPVDRLILDDLRASGRLL